MIFLDLLLIAHFFFMWWRTAQKTGWKLDFWFFNLFLYVFCPVLLMYPFAASKLNRISVGSSYEQIAPFIDYAFGITVLGYFCMWIGRFCYDFFKQRCPLYTLCLFFQPLEKLVVSNIRCRPVIFSLGGAALSLGCFILLLTLSKGYFLHPRSFFSLHETLRPLFNLTVTLIPLTIFFLGLRWIQLKEKWSKYFLLILFFFSIAFGLRSVSLMGILLVGVYSIFAKQGRVSLLKLMGAGGILLFLFLYLDSLRHGEYNPLITLYYAAIHFFYGNHFSDTRDFAWTLACWDETYLYGKSYLAGLISFVPRFLSSYRQEWSYFLYTNHLVGLDPLEHPGLRPTLFGEAFLNFSYFGVIALGFLSGYFLRHADSALKSTTTIIEGYSKTIPYAFISAFFITTGIWGFYLFVLLNLCLKYCFLQKKKKLSYD